MISKSLAVEILQVLLKGKKKRYFPEKNFALMP